jgi:two-component system, cell cycle sensor histidine kinase and response regulator CckA
MSGRTVSGSGGQEASMYRPDPGRRINVSRFDVNEVLAALTPMLGRLIGEDIQLIVRVDPRLGPTRADAAQLEQVVLNLAVNARDAMPDGGTLTISTANVDLDAGFVLEHVGASAGKFVVLVVSDTGTGMTPETREHAVEPFFTTKDRSEGTDLGPSRAFGIVQASGGFIRAESEPGAGSAYSVYLPRLDGEAGPQRPSNPAHKPKGGKETILLAEDENAVRNFVERVLIGAGYRVKAASNGEEAVELAEQMPNLDLLFTDLVMPGMNGVQLAAHLTKARPDLPVIYASGYSDQGVPRGAGHSERISYLPKPFTAETLLLRIREVLDRDPAASATQQAEPSDPE